MAGLMQEIGGTAVARGHFLGDYMGLAASGLNTVYPVFGIATGPNTTAEFTRKISGLP